MSEKNASNKVRITEYLDLDLGSEQWCCNRCDRELGPASKNYKEGTVVNERDMSEVHPAVVEGEQYSFSPDPDYCRLLEFYCPSCGTLIETEYLPPGHPITHDIELDLASLRQKYSNS